MRNSEDINNNSVEYMMNSEYNSEEYIKLNIKRQEKKYSWSTVFAWLYLHTIGEILPKEWNRWAEDILNPYEVTSSKGSEEPQDTKQTLVTEEESQDLKPKAELQRLEKEKEALAYTLAEQEKILNQLTKELEKSKEDLQSSKKEREELSSKHDELSKQLIEIKDELTLKEIEFKALQDASDETAKEYDQEKLRLSEQINKLESQSAMLTEELSTVKNQAEEMKTILSEKEIEWQKILKDKDQITKELDNAKKGSREVIELMKKKLEKAKKDEKKEKLRKRIAELEQQLQDQKNQLDRQIAELTNAEVDSETCNEELKKKVNELQNKNTQLENSQKEAKEDLKQWKGQVEELNSQLKEKIAELINAKTELKNKEEALVNKNQVLEQQLQDQKNQLDRQIAKLTNAKTESDARNEELKKKVNELQNQKTLLENAQKQAKENLKQVTEASKKTINQLKVSNKVEEDINAKIEKLGNDIQKLENKLRSVNTSNAGLTEENSNLKGTLVNLQSENDALKKELAQREEQLNKADIISITSVQTNTSRSSTNSKKSNNPLIFLVDGLKGRHDFKGEMSNLNNKIKKNFPEFAQQHFCHQVAELFFHKLKEHSQDSKTFSCESIVIEKGTSILTKARANDKKVKDFCNNHAPRIANAIWEKLVKHGIIEPGTSMTNTNLSRRTSIASQQSVR
ncbi:MAG: hypothetical protein QWI36_03530 [Wolbachia endosymbiont of Tyrophagus putrescentiae]|nr:hypothetical protein [Wolbachia endosymbiont of Tyrophagus putrescentiae]